MPNQNRRLHKTFNTTMFLSVSWPVGAIVLASLLLARSPPSAYASGQAYQQNSPHQLHAQASPEAPGSLPTENSLSPQTKENLQDLETLRQLEANYLRAEMEDSATLAGSILADDYLGLRADGTAASKSDVLNSLNLHDRTSRPYNVKATNLQEHVFGDTACVTYTKIYTLPNQTSYSEDLLHIFTKHNGVWRLQVSSPLPKPRPPRPLK